MGGNRLSHPHRAVLKDGSGVWSVTVLRHGHPAPLAQLRMMFQISGTLSSDHVLTCFIFPGADASLLGAGPSSSPDGGGGDGDNLLGPLDSRAAARPTLLVDWPKSLVSRARFHGYTSSGRTPPSRSGAL